MKFDKLFRTLAPVAALALAAGLAGCKDAHISINDEDGVPLSELEGYAAELKSATAGRGRYALDFSHYEPVPAQVQQKLVEAYKPRHEEE